MDTSTHATPGNREWDDLANLDPLWAILSDPQRRNGGWSIEEFWETGEAEISHVTQSLAALGHPPRWRRVLDFGCGVGRLSRALSGHCEHCIGLDISGSMVKLALELNRGYRNCEFYVNPSAKLEWCRSHEFDVVYTNIVLQHCSRQAITQYIAEFLRVVNPGGIMVMQLPSFIPWRRRLQLRRKLYSLLRSAGLKPETLYRTMRLSPGRMTSMSEAKVGELLRLLGGRILKSEADIYAGPGIESRTYYVVPDNHRVLFTS